MVRPALLSCTVLFILATCTALAQGPEHNHSNLVSRSPVGWMNGYTLILVDADTKDELTAARDFIVAEGGTVAVVVPPSTIMGWIAPDVVARISGRHKIRSIHRTPVEPNKIGFNDRETQISVGIFNDIASGRRARRTLKRLKRQPQVDATHPPMIDCSLPRPQMNKNELIYNLRSMGATQSLGLLNSQVEPQFFSHSDTMDGTVAVAVFLVESNGAIDPDLYTWSQSDQTSAIAQVIDGVSWWVDQSRAFRIARPLQFTVVPFLATNPICQQPYEPILHEGRDATLWIERITANMGATSSNVFVRVAAINQRMRDEYRTDWAFSTFVAYNPPPARTAFLDGRASWAYIGGPLVNTLFRSFGWELSHVMSHETGHIFYACDEYFQPGYQTCSCSCAPEVRPQATNGNCEDLTCNRNSTICMMRVNEFALCQFTVAQIGWTATVPDPIPTAPTGLVATPSSPTQVTLVWQDTSSTETGFQIDRRGGTDGNFNQIAVVGANSTSFSDSTVQPNTAYAYRVRAFNTTGTSGYTTEAAVITPSTPSSLSVSSTDMPDATVGVPYSRALIASGGSPPYNWIVESGSIPAGLTMSQSGTISGTPTGAGTNNFVVRVTDANNNSATKALTLVVKPTAPLTLTTKELPRGSVGNTYSQNLGASGGQTPYSWLVQSGNLPEGLTLNQTSGIISGTPERAGSSSFLLRLTDAVGASVTATLSIIINPAITVLTLETTSLPDGVVGQNYSQTLRAVGGNAPLRWEIIRGRLPGGLEMTISGVIQGTPETAGESQFEVKVTDQSGQSASRQLAIEIDSAPELTIVNQSPLPAAAIGLPYRVELKAISGTAPYTWNKKKKKKFGNLPDGITLSSEGILSGTPTSQGIFNFTLSVSDSTGKLASKPFSIEVGPPPPPLAVKTESLPNALQGILYNGRLEASGGFGPYAWSIESGILPNGLTLNEAGIISGRPTTLGTTTFTVRVKDSQGTSSTKQFIMAVGPPPPPLTILTIQLPETAVDRPYSERLQASGGIPPYTWSLASGSLGAGFNLSADGVISGTALSPGTSVFTIRVTDSAQQAVSRTLAISIRPADKVAPFGSLEVPDFRATLNNMASGSGWALDNVGVTSVEVLVDGQKVSDGIYGLPRPDVAVVWGSFPNARNSGFSFTFDTTRLANGEHRLSVRLLDAGGNATIIGLRPFNIQNRLFTIIPNNPPRGRKGEPYSEQLIAIDGKPPYTWVIVSGSLPPGLSLNASGVISGTPTAIGNFSFGVRVTDSVGAIAVATFTLTILPDVEPLRIVSSGDLTAGRIGVDYSHQLLFIGGRAPRVWSVASGSLPPGLNLDAEFGLIFGRPTQTGTFTFTMQLRDSTPTTVVSEPLRITISP